MNNRVRSGKTRKDLESGATERRLLNRAIRASWDKGVDKTFPSHVCCGKKNMPKKHNNKMGK